MEINKVLILGIDALEHEVVEQWDLRNLMQEENGKTELPIYPGEDPNTRIIWSCFITGKMPKDMGYVTSKVFKPPLQFFVNMFTPKIKFILNPQSDNPKNIVERKKSKKIHFLNKSYHFLEKIGIVERPSKKYIRSSTIFDTIPKSIHSHIPIYDEYIPSYAKKTVEAIENKTYQPIFEMKCKQEFNQRSKEVFDWFDKKNKWNLGMQYFWCLDGIQHAFFNNDKKIAKFYLMFDEFAEKVRRNIDDDTMLLIISDHGQKKGIHTNYGYYSTNKPLGLKNPNLIDFRWIIEQILEKRKAN